MMLRILVLRHSAFYTPLLLTMAGGLLREEGLAAEYRIAASLDELVDAIAGAGCDLAQSAVATSFAWLERGETPPFVHFAQINERDGFFLVGRSPDPDFELSQLAGRQVLVDHLFQPLAMLRYAVHQAGVDWADIEVVDAGGPDAMVRAFRAGQGDYVHLQGPAAQQLEADGVGRVVAAVGDFIGPVAFSSLCARPDWLAADCARAFMRAYRRARHMAVDLPAAEIAALEQAAGFFTDIDASVLAETIAAYQRLGCWTPEPEITEPAYERLLDVFGLSGGVGRRHPLEACIVNPPEVTI